jgi:oxaloacetate decarboxylase beta subunit
LTFSAFSVIVIGNRVFIFLSGEVWLLEIIDAFLGSIGIVEMTVGRGIMLLISFFLMFLAIRKKYEPLLLLPLAFGILIANIPLAGLDAYFIYEDGRRGLMNFLYQGIVGVIYPPMIFLCIGSMTDFGPLLSNPKTALIGLGGQLGIFVAFFGSMYLGNLLVPVIPDFDGFSWQEAASIGIIGSSDGPTSIFAATRLAPDILPSVAIAAFSYMALVPFIQPPIMKLLTTKKERVIVMPEPKNVSQRKKIIFPIALTVITLLLVPTAGALVAMLMLGNLIRESGVAERYVRALQNDVLNVLTLLVAMSIGSSATADRFLTPKTMIIVACGLLAFVFGTFGGILIAKLLCFLTRGKINPLIGNSGVSAMPMAARISQRMGQKYNHKNHLLMHAMGPIVSSTIGSAIIAGIFIAFFSS